MDENEKIKDDEEIVVDDYGFFKPPRGKLPKSMMLSKETLEIAKNMTEEDKKTLRAKFGLRY
jgi:hypothetical protein